MAKTIKFFLFNGEPNGLKTVELSNWIGQAIVIPGNKLKAIRNRQDCNKPAVYFLFGKENEEALLSTAYIGEAESRCIKIAESVKRFDLENGKKSSLSSLIRS